MQSTSTKTLWPGVTHLEGYPILGRLSLNKPGFDITELLTLSELAYQNERGLVSFYLGPKPVLLVTRPMDIYQLGIANAEHVDRGSLTQGFRKILGPHNLFSLAAGGSDSEWKAKRNKFTSWLFSNKALKEVVPEMQKIADEFIQQIAKQNDTVPSLDKFMINLTMDMIVRTRMGAQHFSEEDANIISHTIEHGMDTMTNPLNFMRSICADSLEDVKPWMWKFAAVVEYVQGMLDSNYTKACKSLREIIDEKFLKPNAEEFTKTNHMLREYFESSKDKSPQELHDAAIEESAATIFAGHETSSKTLDMIVLLLAKNPEIYQKVREEVKQHLPQDGQWTTEALEQLSYLRKVVKEVFRLYPPTPIMVREVTSETAIVLGDIKPCNTKKEYEEAFRHRDIRGDIILEPGTTIIISPFITQRRPNIYLDPTKFNPDRHANGAVAADLDTFQNPQMSCKLIPFGIGARRCPGQRLVRNEVAIFIAELAQRIERLELPADYDNSDTSYIEVKALGTLKPVKLPQIRFAKDPAFEEKSRCRLHA